MNVAIYILMCAIATACYGSTFTPTTDAPTTDAPSTDTPTLANTTPTDAPSTAAPNRASPGSSFPSTDTPAPAASATASISKVTNPLVHSSTDAFDPANNNTNIIGSNNTTPANSKQGAASSIYLANALFVLTVVTGIISALIIA